MQARVFPRDSNPFASPIRFDAHDPLGLEPSASSHYTLEWSQSGAFYCDTAPSPPRRHERQIPNPLPLAWMKPQNEVIRASSPALKPAGENAVSVTAKLPAVGVA